MPFPCCVRVCRLTLAFGTPGATGSVVADSTRFGQVTRSATTLTVGGTTTHVNGWQATDLSLNAATMRSLVITARRDARHAASTVFVQFEEVQLRTSVVSIDSSHFAVGSLTQVAVPLNRWTVDFGPTQIVSGSLGGSDLGGSTFPRTFDHMALSASAIPEPAAFAGLAGPVLAVRRRRRR